MQQLTGRIGRDIFFRRFAMLLFGGTRACSIDIRSRKNRGVFEIRRFYERLKLFEFMQLYSLIFSTAAGAKFALRMISYVSSENLGLRP